MYRIWTSRGRTVWYNARRGRSRHFVGRRFYGRDATFRIPIILVLKVLTIRVFRITVVVVTSLLVIRRFAMLHQELVNEGTKTRQVLRKRMNCQDVVRVIEKVFGVGEDETQQLSDSFVQMRVYLRQLSQRCNYTSKE